MSFINFKTYEFSYLNIANIGSELVQSDTECGFACLGITSCFSYNLAAFSDVNGKLLCELLPSDNFNNSDKFTFSPYHHHLSIPVSTILNLDMNYFSGKVLHLDRFQKDTDIKSVYYEIALPSLVRKPLHSIIFAFCCLF